MAAFWNYEIFGVDVYHIASWFFIYSFLGWVWETSYCSIRQGRFINRGFVFGPCITIYGGGALLMLVLLRRWAGNIPYIYFGGMALATALEYVTSFAMEKIYKARWWDYSSHPLNLNGRVCLDVSLGWGAMAVALFEVLHPGVTWLVNLCPKLLGELLVCAVFIVYAVDKTMSAVAAGKIAKKLTELERRIDELGRRVADIEPIAVWIKEAKLHIDQDREKLAAAQEELEKRRGELDRAMGEKAEELMHSRLAESLERVKKEWMAQQNRRTERFLQSYPELSRKLDQRREGLAARLEELRARRPQSKS